MRENLVKVTSQVNNVLCNVFDTVKETAESNKRKFLNSWSEVCEFRLGNSQRDHRDIENVNALSGSSANLQNSITGLKAQSNESQLGIKWYWRAEGRICGSDFSRFNPTKNKTNYEISFESVHRIGKWNKINYRPRNRLECVDCGESYLYCERN